MIKAFLLAGLVNIVVMLEYGLYRAGFESGRSSQTFVIDHPIDLSNVGDVGLKCEQADGR